METSKLKIELLIPSLIAENLEDGKYTRHGSMIRDELGRVVCNLESLDVAEDHYFSPCIFISFGQYFIFSPSSLPLNLRNALEKFDRPLQSIEAKIDTAINKLDNQIVASISTFREFFSTLSEESNLIDQRHTYRAGVEAAATIAANIQHFLNSYIGATRIYEKGKPYFKGEESTYSTYSKDQLKYIIRVDKTEFENFRQSAAHYFIYNFLEIINDINVLSLFYDKKVHPRYEDNLLRIQAVLITLLQNLIDGLFDEGNIYQIYYTNYSHPNKNDIDIEKILKYDTKRQIDDIVRMLHLAPERTFHWDNNRVESILAVIEILEEIDSLLMRVRDIGAPQLLHLLDAGKLSQLIALIK